MSSNSSVRGLPGVFVAAAERFGERPALEVDGAVLSYDELWVRARRLAATVAQTGTDNPLAAVVMQRSASGFAGILGTLLAGRGYVPMMPSLPPARLSLMIARAEVDTVILDAASLEHLDALVARAKRPLRFICPDLPGDELRGKVGEPASLDGGGHTLVGADALAPAEDWSAPEITPDDIAYLLFTSGSTGEPKGVMVAHRNIERFLDVVVERYGLRETDRFSHLFEITFDLSLFDLFAAWKAGGCLCVPSMGQRLLPSRYVTDAALTVWFSVPSAAVLMKEMRQLSPEAFPDLRVALFCGEALPVPVAEAFAAASPNAVLENIYGPTELTLACTHYRWHAQTPDESENGVVPIGEPYPGMTALVADEDLREVAPGETGELLMAGPQVTLGYWRDPERTAKAFVTPPGRDAVYYRTGDRVRAPREGQPMTFLGRLDSQVKIHGYRVELGEIEAVLRQEAGVDAAIALAWPPTPGGAAGVVAFVVHDALDEKAVLDAVARRLPKYMVPKEIRTLDAFPLNTNGKIDRKALRAQLEA